MEPQIHADHGALSVDGQDQHHGENQGQGDTDGTAVLQHHDPFRRPELLFLNALHRVGQHEEGPHAGQQIGVYGEQMEHNGAAPLRRKGGGGLQNTHDDSGEGKEGYDQPAHQGDKASSALQYDEITVFLHSSITS